MTIFEAIRSPQLMQTPSAAMLPTRRHHHRAAHYLVPLLLTAMLLHMPSSTIAFLTTGSQSQAAHRHPSSLQNAYRDESSFPLNNGNDQQQTSPSTSSSSPQQNHDVPQLSKFKSRPPKIHPDSGGRITLVGSGPGSPSLLTLAAHSLITDPSNLLIVDRLVSAEIRTLMDEAGVNYKIANKTPGCQMAAQDEIFEWCKEGLRNGKHVVRLKIGDPFVFGRGGEEVLQFRQFGVEPTVIPGVSAAFSAPLLASIPVTHRGISNQVVMCTGYGKNNTSPDLIQYHPEQTVVFLMAVGRLRKLCDSLIHQAGYPPQTPVGIVERAGCPEQRTVVGTMESIADLAERFNVRPPSTIVVGEVVNVLLTEEDFVEVVNIKVEQGGLLESDGVVDSAGAVDSEERGGMIVKSGHHGLIV